MTTPHTIGAIWPGQTVAVIGAGPSLTDDMLADAQKYPCIAANRAAVRAPWADMLVSIDGNWPAECETFAGLRVVGIERDDIDALYVSMPHEVVTIAPGHVIHIRNNVLSAIRIAAQAGASEILLYGIDAAEYEALHDFRGFTEGLATLIAEMAAKGVSVRYAGSVVVRGIDHLQGLLESVVPKLDKAVIRKRLRDVTREISGEARAGVKK